MKTVAQYISFTGASGSYGLLPLDVLPGATTFTIEVKFSTTATASSGNNYDWKTIIGREIPGFWQNDFGLCVNGGKLCFWAEPKSGGSSSTRNTTSNAVVNDGQIHEAAVVSSGGAIDLYCDGELVAHTDNVNAKITNAYGIGIANNIDNASASRLQMDLHEARFWSVARSQAEIFADIEGDEEGLEAWYIPTNSSTLIDKSGNGRDATLYGSPVYTEITELPMEFSFDVERVLVNESWTPLKNLISYLPFDTSTTQDLCGNTWTTSGTPTIVDKYLNLPSGSYLLNNSVTVGGKDFTINGWCYMNSSSGSYARVFEMAATDGSQTNILTFARHSTNSKFYFDVSASTQTPTWTSNQWFHFEVVHQYSSSTSKLYINGTLTATITGKALSRVARKLRIGKSSWSSDGAFIGYIDEFQIYDGVALHTANFTPPTAEDYAALKQELRVSSTGENVELSFDVQRKLGNNAEVSFDTQRLLTRGINLLADSQRQVFRTAELLNDVERIISNRNVLVADFDFERILTRTENFFVDVERKLLNAINFSADMERNLTRTVNLNVDVKRTVAKSQYLSFDVERVVPIIVPFIGEHFNHIIGSLSLTRGENKKIILPKKSSVYIRAVGAGIVEVYSDTDANRKILGDNFLYPNELYAALEPCENIFIKIRNQTTPQHVIKAFMKYLADFDGTLDEAINYATGGKFATRDALAVQFMNDLDSSSSYTDFLENYCDIDLDNADTGAITGSDAGGIEKTAESVVPEKIPVEDWIVPDSGEVVTINGLTVRFPNRFSGSTPAAFTAHILAGLYSVWIKQSLDLIEETYGISFNDEAVTRKSLRITLLWDSSNNAIAWTTFSSDATIELTVNTSLFADIDTTSEDGALIPSSPKYYSVGYLDRTIVHELTHAIMRARIKNFSSLPLFIKEGTAELVHGIDDFRYSVIVDLLTTNKSTLEDILTGTIDGTNQDPYAAGYMFLRYLAKQGQNTKLVPAEIEITNLLISDGATDSDYEALTDNTRQIFAADILRALSCSFEGEFDIAILSVLTVKVITDVLRNIIAQVNLFARQKEEPFNPDMPEPTPIDLPVNTKGIRDFEVSIAEQQISDQVRFTAVTPYDVQQEISGQYLDYKYNMVIERVQQQGILHSCECFSNINDLLYTQLNYKIPPITSWYKINGEQVGGTHTVEIKTVYPLASTHATSIAKALKLKAQIQFDNFLSTVLMDEKGGVTYNDLIRDIFGWSSRVPTMLINVFPRDGILFFIQRGHETHSVDITQSKHTVPVITREIVRTSYGSSVESTTTINEYDITAKTFTPDTIVGGEEGDEEEKWVTLQDKSSGENWTATTTYYYSKGNDMSPAGGKIPAGLLVKVETEKSYSYGSEEADSFTQIMHTYDSDGTRIGTETYVHYTGGTNPTTDTRNINLLRYITLPNGEKYLASESTERYEEGETGYPDKLVDSTITNHSPTRLGQTHVITVTDDGIAGGVTGQNTGDDRITPYSQRKAQNAAAAFANANGTWEETTTHYESGMTVYGLALFDSSFPIHDEATLIKVTNAIKALNGKIKETVSLTVYDLEHLIDFDDTITFNGNSYFLVSNTARTTPRILLEQNLTLVRWIY